MSHDRTIEDGRITAYPLTVADINARATPAESYHLCFFGSNRPKASLTHKVVAEPFLIGSAVFVQESLAIKTVEELFVDLYTAAISYDEANQPYLDRSKMRVFRDATHALDTYNGNVHAWCCDLHYQTNRIGTKKKAPNFFL